MSAGELARCGMLPMAEGKYGRLFTEREVRGLVVSAAADGELGAHRDGDATPDEYATRLIGQMTAPTFPPDEPLFLLRGQDVYAPWGAQQYCEALRDGMTDPPGWAAVRSGLVSEAYLEAAWRGWQAMLHFQRANPDRVKVPD